MLFLGFTIQGSINLLVSSTSTEEEPILESFLSFLANDMQQHPEKLQPLTASMCRSAESLVESVEIDFGSPLIEEDE
ncbi:MAG: antitoxin PrlF [Cocleimonas sp.]|jgi:antitoxin PrlF